MNELGGSPLQTPDVNEMKGFNDGNILTPAAAVVADPFDKITQSNLSTPVAERRNPMDRARGIPAN
jgi:hypothetical protein